MDLTTNGVVITDAIKFVQTNKEKLAMSKKENDGDKESEESDYDEDKNKLEEEQKETGEPKQETIKQSFLNLQKYSTADCISECGKR
jgi:hypothetical protein